MAALNAEINGMHEEKPFHPSFASSSHYRELSESDAC